MVAIVMGIATIFCGLAHYMLFDLQSQDTKVVHVVILVYWIIAGVAIGGAVWKLNILLESVVVAAVSPIISMFLGLSGGRLIAGTFRRRCTHDMSSDAYREVFGSEQRRARSTKGLA